MSDSLYDCNWHEVPIHLQKHFIIMIAGAQRPLDYSGYGIINLNLETFCSVSQIQEKLIPLLLILLLTFLVAESCLHLLHDIQDLELKVT